jgi:hypothetical protein
MLNPQAQETIASVMNAIMLETSTVPDAHDSKEALCVCLRLICAMYTQYFFTLGMQETCPPSRHSDVVHVMLKYLSCAEVQKHAIEALQNIWTWDSTYNWGKALNCKDSTQEIYNTIQRGLRALLASILAHEMDAEIQIFGMRALESLLSHTVYSSVARNCFVDNYGLRILKRSMEAHMKNKQVQKSAINILQSVIFASQKLMNRCSTP